MFRRSGSVVAYYVDGDLPDPRGSAFPEALAEHRFRTIETAANEDASAGWVSPDDPTGDSFEFESMDLDAAVWLRLRIDEKKLPAVWVSIYRASAERAAGRKLNARERKELKEDLLRKLLPRVLPKVALIDALWSPKTRMILLFGTAKRVREEFTKLFLKTFTVNLVEADPYGLATRIGLGRERAAYLEQVSPVPWPRLDRNGAHPPLASLAAAPATRPIEQTDDDAEIEDDVIDDDAVDERTDEDASVPDDETVHATAADDDELEENPHE